MGIIGRTNERKKLNKRRTNEVSRRSPVKKKKELMSKGGRHSDNINDVKKLNRSRLNRRTRMIDDELDEDDIDLERTRKRRVKRGRTKEDVKRQFKRAFALFAFITIAFLIIYTISLVKWYGIMKNAMRCENSIILDSSGNVIAVIGENRIQENINIHEVPNDLKNAYIAIEDKTFNKHKGINVRRTGGAILNYITHRGSAAFGGSTITQQVIKNVTGENETKITRKITEWDRAIKTELLFSKDDILQTYFNIIYVGPNVYGVKMGAKYYFDKDVKDLSLAECAYMAGLTKSPNSYNPFNGKNNSDLIKDRTITVLNEMRQQGYISEDECNSAVQEVNNGLKFKQGDLKPKGDGVYSYMADATINEVIQDLAKEKKISTSFATNYLYLGGLKIHSTQNSDIQKAIEEECSKNAYILKSNVNKNTTSQAAMIIVDQKKRLCSWLCWRLRQENNSKRTK